MLRGVDMVKENGPWFCYMGGNRIGVASDDFTHDVVLWVSGDFENTDQQVEYAEEIAKRLNAYQVREEL